ncbi:hypothetical protein L1987_55372 [Smallanthus sonchifolius]|uniref:Uncharacterized protein n=1 Tax=Smallanthus sonchifolius TaxID=185202 RepID=A0ACB9E9I3_9ASTR|nr:hypothetical protein L1987_55372 [Smallanthus sonchifolius]
MEEDGFNLVVDTSWKPYSSGSNVSELTFFKDNLKCLNHVIKSWNKVQKEKNVSLKMDLDTKLKKGLEQTQLDLLKKELDRVHLDQGEDRWVWSLDEGITSFSTSYFITACSILSVNLPTCQYHR